jgi:hypothetical protein
VGGARDVTLRGQKLERRHTLVVGKTSTVVLVRLGRRGVPRPGDGRKVVHDGTLLIVRLRAVVRAVCVDRVGVRCIVVVASDVRFTVACTRLHFEGAALAIFGGW